LADSPGNLVPCSTAFPEIEDADLLLYRDGSAFSWLIRLWTHSPYSHVATAYWDAFLVGSDHTGDVNGRRLCIVDTREGVGGQRSVPLFTEVQKEPGMIDVFGVDTERFPEYDRQKAVQWALANIPGKPYGRLSIWHILRTRLPFLRLWRKPDRDDLADIDGDHVCSTARAAMDRLGGGVDAVRGVADAFVSPGMLSQSLLFRYRMTLVPDSGQEAKP